MAGKYQNQSSRGNTLDVGAESDRAGQNEVVAGFVYESGSAVGLQLQERAANRSGSGNADWDRAVRGRKGTDFLFELRAPNRVRSFEKLRSKNGDPGKLRRLVMRPRHSARDMARWTISMRA